MYPSLLQLFNYADAQIIEPCDLTCEPKPALEPMAPHRLSQLLLGEAVQLLSRSGGYVEVLALHQPRWGPSLELPWCRCEKPYCFVPYRGWIPESAIGPIRSSELLSIVVSHQALARSAPSFEASPVTSISLGSLVRARAQERGWHLLEGIGWIYDKELAPCDWMQTLSSESLRWSFVNSLERFSTSCYVWGGLGASSGQLCHGLDCSGLVHLCCRRHGVVMARDAKDQYRWLSGVPFQDRAIGSGDLLFLSPSSCSEAIEHVMIYARGDGEEGYCYESSSSIGGYRRRAVSAADLPSAFADRSLFVAPCPIIEEIEDVED